MGELERQVWPGVARWVGSGAVGPGVAAVCELIGLAAGATPGTGTALGAPVAVAVGSAAEGLFDASSRLYRRRVENVSRFTATAAQEAGVPAEQLLATVAADDRLLEVFAQTAEAASRALEVRKIDVLARVFVRGAREGADVDGVALAVEAVRQLERPHLRLLEVLATPNPEAPRGQDEPPVAAWEQAYILAADPGLRGALEALVGKVTGLGLAYDVAVGAFVGYRQTLRLTDFGRLVVGYLRERGQALAADDDVVTQPV